MSYTLAIDTSTGISVGLACGEEPIDSRYEPSTRLHVEKTQQLVNELLVDNKINIHQISQVVAGVGPGPFTGLRIGVVTARTIAYVRQIPVLGVCSLDAIALSWFAEHCEPVIVATDARRKELYWAQYDGEGKPIIDPQVSDPKAIPEGKIIGPGVKIYSDIFAQREFADASYLLDAALLAARFNQLPERGLEPMYLRNADAVVPKTRKSVLTRRRLQLPAVNLKGSQ